MRQRARGATARAVRWRSSVLSVVRFVPLLTAFLAVIPTIFTLVLAQLVPILAPLLLVGLLLLEVRLEHALVGGELGLVGCDSGLVVRSAILRELLPVIDDLLVRGLHLRLVGLHVRAVLLDLRFVARDLLIGRIVVVRSRGRTDQEQSRRDSTHQVPDHVLPPRPSCQPHLPRRTRHPTRALTTRPCAPSADERRHRCARVGGRRASRTRTGWSRRFTGAMLAGQHHRRSTMRPLFA